MGGSISEAVERGRRSCREGSATGGAEGASVCRPKSAPWSAKSAFQKAACEDRVKAT